MGSLNRTTRARPHAPPTRDHTAALSRSPCVMLTHMLIDQSGPHTWGMRELAVLSGLKAVSLRAHL